MKCLRAITEHKGKATRLPTTSPRAVRRNRILSLLAVLLAFSALLSGCQNEELPPEIEMQTELPQAEAMTVVETTTPEPTSTGASTPNPSPDAVAEAPSPPAKENIAAQYAPTPNFQMSFERQTESGGTETAEYRSVALTGMPEGYISTVYRVDRPGEFTHYFFDVDGLRIVEDYNFEDGKLALPYAMESGSGWDTSQLMRVEVDGEYSLGAEVESAFVLVSGEDSDEFKVYSMGMGLVGHWDNASGEGTAIRKLSQMQKIDEETAQSGFGTP